MKISVQSLYIPKQNINKKYSINTQSQPIQKNFIFSSNEIMAGYNIAFAGKKTPIYVFTQTTKLPTKYDSISTAARALKVTPQTVTNYRNQCANGISVINASEIEVKDENGNISLNREKVNEILSQLKHLPKDSRYNPVYAISKDGTLKKFDSQTEAKRELRITTGGLQNAIVRQTTLKGKRIVCADEIARKNNNGEWIVDDNKVKEIAQSLNEQLKQKKANEIYIIHENGDFEKCMNVYDVSKKLDITESTISSVLSGRLKRVKGSQLIKASELEVKNEDGTVSIDESKLNEIIANLKETQEKSRAEAIYIIKRNGEYKRYESTQVASEDLGIKREMIYAANNGAVKTLQEMFVVSASEVENANEDGTIQVDEKRMNGQVKLLNDILRKREEKGIYLIHPDGTYKKFDSMDAVTQELDVSVNSVNRVLSGKARTVKGTIPIRAYDLEIQNDNGAWVINKEKLEEINKVFADIAEEKKQDALYIIREDGSYQKFESADQVAKELGVFKPTILNAAAERTNRVKGTRIVRAVDIETQNEDGTTQIDEEKLKQNVQLLALQLKKQEPKAIYAIYRNGSYQRFASAKDIEKELGISPSVLYHVLNDLRKTANEIRFVYAEKIEHENEDGTIQIDEEMLEKNLQILLKTPKTNESETIYLINKDGTFKQYDYSQESAKELGVLIPNLKNVLTGRSNKIKGIFAIRSSEIECVNEQGARQIDKTKLEKIIQMLNSDEQKKESNGFYLVNVTGKYKKFASLSEIAKLLNVPESILSSNPNEIQTIKGMMIFKASAFETKNENGEIIPNKDKIKEAIRRLNK